MKFNLRNRIKKNAAPKAPKTLVPTGFRRRHAFRAAKGSRFILFLGDEGAILVYLKDNQVISRQFVPDAGQPNLDELKQTLEKNPKAPLMLVVDSMDQSYVQQTLPPVSAMSVGRLVKRRLDRDFTNSDIKGSIILGREKIGRKDWNFMMIALERTPQLNVWIDFIMELPNRFKGIHLVSVETESILKVLERALGIPKEGTGAEWKFFVSHNKVGGFRQVILHKGRIVFTRLAQPLADVNPEVVAGSIEQEMLSTIEYMKRLSFNPQAGLDIYILASSSIKEALDLRKFNASSAQVFTPYEMAGFFNIEGATQPTDQFGDVVLAALIGSSRSHALTLSVPQYRKLDMAYNAMLYQRIFAAVSLALMVGYSVSMAYDIYGLSGDIERLERQKNTEQNTLTALRAEIARTNLDVEKATDLIDLYKQMLQENLSPQHFIEQLRPLIVSPISLKSIEWSVVDDPKTLALSPPEPGAPAMPVPGADPSLRWMTAKLTVELPAVATDPKARRIIMTKVMSDFKSQLAGYDVSAPKEAQNEEMSQQFKLSSETEETSSAAATSSDALVEEIITVIGPLPVANPPEAAAAP